MIVCGIDLSGPTNTRDTAVASFRIHDGQALRIDAALGAGDEALLAHVRGLLAVDGRVVVALDAPLSYNPGGGDRAADRDLRAHLSAAGLRAATVMPPTMTRMVYLTLRGMGVARLLATLAPAPQILEVHPAGALALHGASPVDVLALKRDRAARQRLLAWLEGQGMQGAAEGPADSDHLVAAQAAALAAWRWAEGRPAWVAPAQPPLHPFDYAC